MKNVYPGCRKRFLIAFSTLEGSEKKTDKIKISQFSLQQHRKIQFLAVLLNRMDHKSTEGCYLVPNCESFRDSSIENILKNDQYTKNFHPMLCYNVRFVQWKSNHVIILTNRINRKITIADKMIAVRFSSMNVFIWTRRLFCSSLS